MCAAVLLVPAGTPCESENPALSCILREARVTPSPMVENGRMTYQIDLLFNKVPTEFLTYYQPERSAIIVDVYGLSIFSEVTSIRRNLIFKNLRVENITSTMSLSGEGAHIIIGSDPGWRIGSANVGDTILRLSVSRLLSTQSSQTSVFPWHWVVLGITNALAIAAVWTVVSILPQAPR